MKKATLGGTLFYHNAISQDYCIEEAVQSLKALCDKVVLLDAGSDDGTSDILYKYLDEKVSLLVLPKSIWDGQKGHDKLSYFTNLAISALDTDWNFNLQADEVIHESCFETIREAIEDEFADGYWVSRINLWGDSSHYLDVPYNRKPVGDQIIRLCRSNCQSIGDAQSIHCPTAQWQLVDDIRIYHMGFVRSKYVHTKKIKHMLEEIFLQDNDSKVEAMNGVFDCWGMGFTRDDLKPVKEPLPKFVQEWAMERDKLNETNL